MIGIIIQARTGSIRLPKKMILPFFKGKGILETILIRIKEAKLDIPVVLATTTSQSDDVLEEIAIRQEIPFFRGSEHNVLDRFIQAGEKHKFDKIVRICADNPFFLISALEKQLISFYESKVDYWCYALSDKTPTIKTHYGFWTEGVTLSALKKIVNNTNDRIYQEHVTNYIYSHPSQFIIHFEPIEKEIENEKNIRLTIDTEDDFKLGQEIFNDFNEFKLSIEGNEILKHLRNNPNYLIKMREVINQNSK